MERYLTISEAADLLRVSESTLRRWEKEGRLKPDTRTEGNQRRYKLSSIRPEMRQIDLHPKKTLAYARVSSRDQQDDLERQRQILELFCSSQGWQYEIISDFGSGINYYKKGLKKLLQELIDGKVGRLVLTHKDRLLRFGAELVFAICEARDVEVLILNQEEDTSFEEDLTKDVLEIITVFSARLYGARSRKNQKLLGEMKRAVGSAGSS